MDSGGIGSSSSFRVRRCLRSGLRRGRPAPGEGLQPAAEGGREEGTGEWIAAGADLDELLDLTGVEDAGRLGLAGKTLDAGEDRLELAAEESRSPARRWWRS